MNSIPLRRCKVCQQEFPATSEYFYPNKTYACGLSSKCKTCHNRLMREWTTNHPEKANGYKRAYVERNPEKVQQSKKRWTRNNLPQLAIKTNRYRIEYPEIYAAHQAVQAAVKRNKLPKVSLQRCRICDKKAHHYHHHSYEVQYQLDVMPLCGKCHILIHKYEDEN